MDDLHYKTLTEIANLLRTKQISSVEVTSAVLDRIVSFDGILKSYRTVLSERALNAAKRADEEITAGNYRGTLHGVPVAVKDLCFTKGIPTMGGTAVLSSHIPDFRLTVPLESSPESRVVPPMSAVMILFSPMN